MVVIMSVFYVVSVLLIISLNPILPSIGLNDYDEFRVVQAIFFCFIVYKLATSHILFNFCSDKNKINIHLQQSLLFIFIGIILSTFIHYTHALYFHYPTSLLPEVKFHSYYEESLHIKKPPLATPLLHALLFTFLILTMLFFKSIRLKSYIQHSQALKFFFISLVFSLTILYSFINLKIFFTVIQGEAVNSFVVLSEFENIRIMTQFQIITIPFLILFSIYNIYPASSDIKNILLSKYIRYLSFFCLTSSYLFILVSAGRAALIACAFSSAAVFYFEKSKYKTNTISITSAVCLYLIMNYFEPNSASILRTDSSLRLEMWGELFYKYDYRQLIFGIGGGNYPAITSIAAFAHPHSWIMQWLNDWGGISLLGFISLCVLTFKIGIKEASKIKKITENKKNIHSSLKIYNYTLISWLSILIYGLFDGVMVMPLPQLSFFILTGILLSPIATYKKQIQDEIKLKKKRIKKILYFLLITYLILFVFSYVSSQNLKSPFYGPGFWLLGDPI